MTAPTHSIPAGSPPDASAALPLGASGALIPASPPAAGAPAVSAPLGGRGTISHAALTLNELAALDFIRDVIAATGVAPTLDELAAAFGWHSRSSAHRIVESLIGQGMLVKTAARKRGLALASVPLLSSVPTDALRAELARRQEGL